MIKRGMFFCTVAILLIYKTLWLSVDSSDSGNSAEQGRDEAITRLMEQHQILGMSVTWIDKGAVKYRKGFGYKGLEKKVPVTPQTVLDAKSVEQLAFSLLVNQLTESGQLNPDKPLSRYLPRDNLSQRSPGFRMIVETLTLRHLLQSPDTMSEVGSLVFNTLLKKQALTSSDFKREMHQVFNPSDGDADNSEGTASNSEQCYLSVGMLFLQHVLERELTTSLTVLFDKNLFEPLHMNSSRWWRSQNRQSDLAGYRAMSCPGIQTTDDLNTKRSEQTLCIDRAEMGMDSAFADKALTACGFTTHYFPVYASTQMKRTSSLHSSATDISRLLLWFLHQHVVDRVPGYQTATDSLMIESDTDKEIWLVSNVDKGRAYSVLLLNPESRQALFISTNQVLNDGLYRLSKQLLRVFISSKTEEINDLF